MANCSICRHDRRYEINSALLAGGSIRDVGEQFGVAKSSVDRHRRKCLGPQVAIALARHEDVNATRLVNDLLGIRERLAMGVIKTGAAEEWGSLVALSGEYRKLVELVGRLTGDLESGGGVKIDARRQVAVLAAMSEDELRALARSAMESPDALAAPLPSPAIETSTRALPAPSGLPAQPGTSSRE